MAIRHRCIDIEDRKTAGSDNPLSILVWLIMTIATMVMPFGIWAKLFVIAIEYVACRFFIRGTEREMRFYLNYALSARTYTNIEEDQYLPLEDFCKPIIKVADDGKPEVFESLF